VDKKKIHWISWKKTCRQKRAGGMGFRDLQAFNAALLAKQGWRILTKPHSLMAKALKAKYFPQQQFLQAKMGSRPSYSWQSIYKASWILKKGCFWLIGNGRNTNIWNDRWIHTQEGNTTWTPKPQNSPLNLVSDLIDQNNQQWNSQLIAQTFIPIEVNQILQTPISNEDDIICWQGTKDGHYTVRSGYNAQIEWAKTQRDQAQTSNSLEDNHMWDKLWKIEAPPKQLHLLWRVLHNALPTKTNLLAKGILYDSLCVKCSKSPETIDHIFLHCEWARLVWFGSPITITTTNIHTKTLFDWLIYMLKNSTKQSMQVISTIIYIIWLVRNSMIY
jgi:hypothetical protein